MQVSGFEDIGLLTPLCRLIRFLFVRPAFCLGLPSDSQSPATPLPSANTSPCRVCRGLSPPSRPAHHHSEPNSASHGATRHAWRTKKKPRRMRGWNNVLTLQDLELLVTPAYLRYLAISLLANCFSTCFSKFFLEKRSFLSFFVKFY